MQVARHQIIKLLLGFRWNELLCDGDAVRVFDVFKHLPSQCALADWLDAFTQRSKFFLGSPLSRGAILADEVGLGKTIEAGILLSQKWAEKKQKLLIIVPAALRKQWNQELTDKFFLSSLILENKSFNQIIKTGNLNPLVQKQIIICSYHFARAKDVYIKQVNWDLVIVDEAHRLRNVYKPANRIANAIKNAIADAPKVLLTATPLQNSLLELYGLVSVIDDYTFGDLKSFKAQFGTLRTEGKQGGINLVGIQVNLGISQRSRQLLQAVGRTPLRQFVS